MDAEVGQLLVAGLTLTRGCQREQTRVLVLSARPAERSHRLLDNGPAYDRPLRLDCGPLRPTALGSLDLQSKSLKTAACVKPLRQCHSNSLAVSYCMWCLS